MSAWQRAATTFVLFVLLAAPSGIGLAQIDPFQEMRTLIEHGHYASASQIVGPNLVQAHPNSADAHYLYSLSLYLTGNTDSAREQLERARALDDSRANPDYGWLQGLLEAAEGRYSNAVRLLKNAFLRSREYVMAMDWGRVAWQSGDLEEALEAFGAAGETEQGRHEVWPHLNRGRIHIYRGEYDAAIDALTRVIEVFEATAAGSGDLPSPAYVEAFYRLGEVYEALGEIAQAELNYENALAADPNYVPAIRAIDRLKRQPN